MSSPTHLSGNDQIRTTASHVLVVEDESDIRNLITLHLKRAGYISEESGNGEEAIQKIRQGKSYQLIILDWMLPQASGLDVLKVLRESVPVNPTPVLMLTAKASTSDIVFGLESGADDYMTKPFEPVVLLARVRALLRRTFYETPSGQADVDAEIIDIGDLHINSRSYEVKLKNEFLQLTPSEFKLLHALAINRGRVLTRDQLIELVQGGGVAVVDRAIDTHVFGLRKKMGDGAKFVETVRGIGYRINFTNN